MEINLENAFMIVLRISINPFISSVDVVAQKVQEFWQKFAVTILQNPVLSTLGITCILLPLISIVTISIIITTGVLCMLVVIILIEAFILAMIIDLAFAITTSCFSIVILLTGVGAAYSVKN